MEIDIFVLQFNNLVKNKKNQLNLKHMGSDIISESIIICPECGFSKEEAMPLFAHQYFYKCSNCGKTLRPKQGSCCIFSSYDSVKCPSKQRIENL